MKWRPILDNIKLLEYMSIKVPPLIPYSIGIFDFSIPYTTTGISHKAKKKKKNWIISTAVFHIKEWPT
jgi:hypothetical protein